MNLCRQISSRRSPDSSRTTVIAHRGIRKTYCSNCFPSGSSTLAIVKRMCGFASTSRSPWIVHRVRTAQRNSLPTNGRYPQPSVTAYRVRRLPRPPVVAPKIGRLSRLSELLRPGRGMLASYRKWSLNTVADYAIGHVTGTTKVRPDDPSLVRYVLVGLCRLAGRPPLFRSVAVGETPVTLWSAMVVSSCTSGSR